MEQILKSIFKLKEQGYVEIDHHEDFIIAKSTNGKYCIIDSKELKPLEGSECDQIVIRNGREISMIQDGVFVSGPPRKQILKSISKLKEQGYTEIEHHEDFIIAKLSNGKYCIIDSEKLRPLEGSESDKIMVLDRDKILMIQNGTFITFQPPIIDEWL